MRVYGVVFTPGRDPINRLWADGMHCPSPRVLQGREPRLAPRPAVPTALSASCRTRSHYHTDRHVGSRLACRALAEERPMYTQRLMALRCWPCAFYAAGALVLIGMVVPGMPVWALDDEAARATLKGLPGVAVGVGDITPELADSGVTTPQVQTAVEQQLRR